MIREKSGPNLELYAEICRWCSNYSIWILAATAPSKREHVYWNATCSFLNTGKRVFGVTNQHVIKAYREKKTENPDLIFQIGELVFDVEKRLISENKNLDLVTIAITDEELSKIGKEACTRRGQHRASKNDVVFFAGYPGVFRRSMGPKQVGLESTVVMELVESCSDKRFTMVFDKSTWTSFAGRQPLELTSLGGFSGAMVFRVDFTKALLHPEPIGIIFEGGNNLGVDVQLASHLDFIDDDGLIIEPLW